MTTATQPQWRPATTFSVQLPVAVRPCTADDLPALEWFGTFTHHRELLQLAYARQQKGNLLILLAVAGEAPVGQVWLDFAQSRDPQVGWIRALRVFPWLRNHGIGSRLLDVAEAGLARAGRTRACLSVAETNLAARRLYERRGYRRIERVRGEHRCTTPWGTWDHFEVREWLMRKDLPVRDPGRESFTADSP